MALPSPSTQASPPFAREAGILIEDACALAIERPDVGLAANGACAALAPTTDRLVRLLRENMAGLSLPWSAPMEGMSTVPQKVETIAGAVRDASKNPLAKVYLSALAARSAARASIEHREPTVAADGSLVWVLSASVHALVLCSLHELKRAAASAFPDVFVTRATRTEVSRGSPFRDSPELHDPVPERSIAMPRIERHLERALLLTSIYDAWCSPGSITGEGNPFQSGRPTTNRALHDEATELRRLVLAELAAARTAFVRTLRREPAMHCAALVIEVVEAFRALTSTSLEASLRSLRASLDELHEALATGYELGGTPRSLLADPTDDWSWCDEYFLATLAARAARPQRKLLGFLGGDDRSRENEALWRDLYGFVDRARGAPTTADYTKAIVLENALQVNPPAQLFFAIPSIRTLATAVRSIADEESAAAMAFDHSITGVKESELALRAFAMRALAAFGVLPSHGQLLQRHVESALFGVDRAGWTELPAYADPY